MDNEFFYQSPGGELTGPFDRSNYIHPTCEVFPGVKMGKNNYFGPYCIIGGPGEHKSAWNPHFIGNVEIGDGNIFTGANTIDSAVPTGENFRVTKIGNNCMFLKRAHVGHNAEIEDNCIISVNVVVGGHCIICQDTNLGVGAFIHQRQVIAPFCMIGAGAVVAKGLLTRPFRTYAGVPAQILGDNKHWLLHTTKNQRDKVYADFADNQESYWKKTSQ